LVDCLSEPPSSNSYHFQVGRQFFFLFYSSSGIIIKAKKIEEVLVIYKVNTI
jgi:hypothetical protein